MEAFSKIRLLYILKLVVYGQQLYFVFHQGFGELVSDLPPKLLLDGFVAQRKELVLCWQNKPLYDVITLRHKVL